MNRWVDSAAKEPLNSPITDSEILYTDFHYYIFKYIRTTWQFSWNEAISNKNHDLKLILGEWREVCRSYILFLHWQLLALHDLIGPMCRKEQIHHHHQISALYDIMLTYNSSHGTTSRVSFLHQFPLERHGRYLYRSKFKKVHIYVKKSGQQDKTCNGYRGDTVISVKYVCLLKFWGHINATNKQIRHIRKIKL